MGEATESEKLFGRGDQERSERQDGLTIGCILKWEDEEEKDMKRTWR